LDLKVVDFITKAQLRAFAAEMSLNEQVTLRKSASSRPLTGATFLSHSSKDDDLVVGATRVLEGHGATVYIDEVDPAMPPYTSKQTADLLKQRIKQTQKFVLLASSNSKESRWVPWELGIADGYKGLERIALFPTAENSDDTKWASWEYLGLYRRIVWGSLRGYEKPLWMVHNWKQNTATTLRSWLKA
jgi:TIR domain